MTTTIELSSGKIINLNRFVALIPDEKAENEQYHLILEGFGNAIALDETEATCVGSRRTTTKKSTQTEKT
jgi:hypothetical protein